MAERLCRLQYFMIFLDIFVKTAHLGLSLEVHAEKFLQDEKG